MAFRARKVFETFEKRAPAPSWPDSIGQVIRATFSCNLWRNVVAKLCCPYYHPRKQLVKHQDLLPKVGPSSTSCNMLLQLATLKFVAREVACGGGNTVNKALQLAKQQCCVTSCTKVLPVLLDLIAGGRLHRHCRGQGLSTVQAFLSLLFK